MQSSEAYLSYVKQILATGRLTNSGPLAEELCSKLKQRLGSRNLVLTSSGTVALQIALKTLRVQGNVITTPFTYVATANAIAWIGLRPIFADIRESDLCIDPLEIENLLDEETAAILPVHAFGSACNIAQIEALSKAAGVPSVYDAAACFDVRYRNQSILNFGNLSVLSFHATKVFSTVEGGAVFFGDKDLSEQFRAIVHHGCAMDRSIVSLGTNAKMSELHAAYGLSMLDHVSSHIEQRKSSIRRLRSYLSIDRALRFPVNGDDSTSNGTYFPIVMESEQAVLDTQHTLREAAVEARRYYFPSLNTVPHFKGPSRTPIADDVSRRVLCLNPDAWSCDQLEQIAEIVLARGKHRLKRPMESLPGS